MPICDRIRARAARRGASIPTAVLVLGGLLCALVTPVHAAVTVFPMDLAGFNVAAGDPPVVVDFDGVAPGTDVGGQAIGGVAFSASPTGAPLIVVRAANTTTPAAAFSGIVDAATNTLPATSGQNVLSPGGTTLGPGPDAAVENDDVVLTFAAPVAAVGFDHLSQSADGFSFTNVTVYDAGNNVLFSGSIPASDLGGGGAPAGADFWGIVSDANDIARVEIDEGDGNSDFPDCNIGVDTVRVGGLPTTMQCDAVALARIRLSARCSCLEAAQHGAYVRCVAQAAKAEVRAGTLAKGDARQVKACAARSTCGKAGFVTCCRTNAKGMAKCSIRRGAAKCKAPKGGSARTGTHASCCEACAATGCPVPDS